MTEGRIGLINRVQEPEDDYVANGRCLECRGSYEKLAEKSASAQFPMRNPHRSHLVGLDCTKCHVAHGVSRSYCTAVPPHVRHEDSGGRERDRKKSA